jgi:hypothetical protein
VRMTTSSMRHRGHALKVGAAMSLGAALLGALAAAAFSWTAALVGVGLIAAALVGLVGLRCVQLLSRATGPTINSVGRLRRPVLAAATRPEPRRAPTADAGPRHAVERPALVEVGDQRNHQRVHAPALKLTDDLERVARAAARGEHDDRALRAVDRTLEALEMDDAVLLRDAELDGVVVRRALISRAGVFVVLARLEGAWALSDTTLLDAQVVALARALGLARSAVSPLIVVEGSADGPRSWFAQQDFARAAAVVGREQLIPWLDQEPDRLDEATLTRLRVAIADALRTHEERPALPVHHG